MIGRAAFAALVLALAACGSDNDAPTSTAASAAASSLSGLAPRFAPAPSPRARRPAAYAAPGAEICGDPRLNGRALPTIQGRLQACRVERPVEVRTVAGVKLSRPIRVNCRTAKAFADWTEGAAKPSATRILNATLASMRPVASFACRTRNSRQGARLSEHSKGNAVDIAEFTLSDGRSFTVEKGWPASGATGRFFRSVWKSACGPFGTVLGPASDIHHRDHLHFDTARHMNGPYCR